MLIRAYSTSLVVIVLVLIYFGPKSGLATFIAARPHPVFVSEHHEQLGPPPGVKAQAQVLAGEHPQLPVIVETQVLVGGQEGEEQLVEPILGVVHLQVALDELVGAEQKLQILGLDVEKLQVVVLTENQKRAAASHSDCRANLMYSDS